MIHRGRYGQRLTVDRASLEDGADNEDDRAKGDAVLASNPVNNVWHNWQRYQASEVVGRARDSQKGASWVPKVCAEVVSGGGV